MWFWDPFFWGGRRPAAFPPAPAGSRNVYVVPARRRTFIVGGPAVSWLAYRAEKDTFTADFTKELNPGEAVQRASVAVRARDGDEDLGGDFVQGNPSAFGSLVSFVKASADAGSATQAAGLYVVTIEATTTLGRVVVARVPLEVKD